MSARNLESPTFAATVVQVLRELGGRPSDLVLEVTETALPFDHRTARKSLHALDDAGLELFLDDSGTGSSGILQFARSRGGRGETRPGLPPASGQQPRDGSIAAAVVELAHGLGCRVVAEGVEDPAAAAQLKLLGCDQAQGLLYERPLPLRQLLVETGLVAPPGRVLVR